MACKIEFTKGPDGNVVDVSTKAPNGNRSLLFDALKQGNDLDAHSAATKYIKLYSPDVQNRLRGDNSVTDYKHEWLGTINRDVNGEPKLFENRYIKSDYRKNVTYDLLKDKFINTTSKELEISSDEIKKIMPSFEEMMKKVSDGKVKNVDKDILDAEKQGISVFDFYAQNMIYKAPRLLDVFKDNYDVILDTGEFEGDFDNVVALYDKVIDKIIELENAGFELLSISDSSIKIDYLSKKILVPGDNIMISTDILQAIEEVSLLGQSGKSLLNLNPEALSIATMKYQAMYSKLSSIMKDPNYDGADIFQDFVDKNANTGKPFLIMSKDLQEYFLSQVLDNYADMENISTMSSKDAYEYLNAFVKANPHLKHDAFNYFVTNAKLDLAAFPNSKSFDTLLETKNDLLNSIKNFELKNDTSLNMELFTKLDAYFNELIDALESFGDDKLDTKSQFLNDYLDASVSDFMMMQDPLISVLYSTGAMQTGNTNKAISLQVTSEQLESMILKMDNEDSTVELESDLTGPISVKLYPGVNYKRRLSTDTTVKNFFSISNQDVEFINVGDDFALETFLAMRGFPIKKPDGSITQNGKIVKVPNYAYDIYTNTLSVTNEGLLGNLKAVEAFALPFLYNEIANSESVVNEAVKQFDEALLNNMTSYFNTNDTKLDAMGTYVHQYLNGEKGKIPPFMTPLIERIVKKLTKVVEDTIEETGTVISDFDMNTKLSSVLKLIDNQGNNVGNPKDLESQANSDTASGIRYDEKDLVFDRESILYLTLEEELSNPALVIAKIGTPKIKSWMSKGNLIDPEGNPDVLYMGIGKRKKDIMLIDDTFSHLFNKSAVGYYYDEYVPVISNAVVKEDQELDDDGFIMNHTFRAGNSTIETEYYMVPSKSIMPLTNKSNASSNVDMNRYDDFLTKRNPDC